MSDNYFTGRCFPHVVNITVQTILKELKGNLRKTLIDQPSRLQGNLNHPMSSRLIQLCFLVIPLRKHKISLLYVELQVNGAKNYRMSL